MKFLIIMIVVALNLPVLARTPIHMDKKVVRQLAGKEVLQSLIRQTPWDRARLAHIIKLELLEDTNAADYVPNAVELLERLVMTESRKGELAKLLLWEITTPRGRRHWLLGVDHYIRLGSFSAATRQQIDALVADIEVYVHEGKDFSDTSLPIEQYLTIDHQLIVMAQRQDKKVVPLENWLDSSIASASILKEQLKGFNNLLQLARQLETSSDAEIKAEIEAAIEADVLEDIDEMETMFRERQAYLHGDHEALLGFHQDGKWHLPDGLNEDLLNSRNREWLPKIRKVCKSSKTCLIVAGYGHFLYDREDVASIITMLRELNYRVELVQP